MGIIIIIPNRRMGREARQEIRIRLQLLYGRPTSSLGVSHYAGLCAVKAELLEGRNVAIKGVFGRAAEI